MQSHEKPTNKNCQLQSLGMMVNLQSQTTPLLAMSTTGMVILDLYPPSCDVCRAGVNGSVLQ